VLLFRNGLDALADELAIYLHFTLMLLWSHKKIKSSYRYLPHVGLCYMCAVISTMTIRWCHVYFVLWAFFPTSGVSGRT